MEHSDHKKRTAVCKIQVKIIEVNYTHYDFITEKIAMATACIEGAKSELIVINTVQYQ